MPDAGSSRSDWVGGENISRYQAIGVKLWRVEEMVAVLHGECRAQLRVNQIRVCALVCVRQPRSEASQIFEVPDFGAFRDIGNHRGVECSQRSYGARFIRGH